MYDAVGVARGVVKDTHLKTCNTLRGLRERIEMNHHSTTGSFTLQEYRLDN